MLSAHVAENLSKKIGLLSDLLLGEISFTTTMYFYI